MEIQLGNKSIKVNEEGYLTDHSQWDKEIGQAIAEKEGIALTPKHWETINYLQEQHKKEVALSVRKIKNSGVVDIKEFYALFPNGPLKKATKIAGIPKPASCI
jgi:TusE/DsrC/DsvC family sulfur relay protein